MEMSNKALTFGGTINQYNVTGITPEDRAALVRPYEELSETQKKLIARLETALDLNQRQIRAALEILGEAHVAPEHLGPKLVEIAEQFKSLQAAAAAQSGDTPQIAAQKTEAKEAIEAGDLAKADVLLAQIQEAKRRARDQLKQMLDRSDIEDAETSAQRGDIALARLRYAEAAQHFAEAARTLPPGNDHARWNYLIRQAGALYRQGYEFGNSAALSEAINVFRRSLALAPRSERPLEWAGTQNNLGLALTRLGEREGEPAHLTEGVSTFREALQVYTREREPLDWARTQMNLGLPLRLLGELKGRPALLEEAAAACREALKENTRERVPIDWAMTQMSLGGALLRHGELASRTDLLNQAIDAFHEALRELTPERVLLEWAGTQMNLGTALKMLGERESGTVRLKEAVAAYHKALQELSCKHEPHWGMAQSNLAEVYLAFFDKTYEPRYLDDALRAVGSALDEFRKAKRDFYIEKAEHLRQKILAVKRKL